MSFKAQYRVQPRNRKWAPGVTLAHVHDTLTNGIGLKWADEIDTWRGTIRTPSTAEPSDDDYVLFLSRRAAISLQRTDLTCLNQTLVLTELQVYVFISCPFFFSLVFIHDFERSLFDFEQ